MRLFEFNSTSKKVILTDVDGVLLNHSDGMVDYFHSLGYPTLSGMENEYMYRERFGIPDEVVAPIVNKYNSSDQIKNLSPLPGAVEGVKKLVAAGYTFHAITAVSERGDVCDSRRKNLQNVFGENVFPDNRVTCIGIGTSKTPELSKFANSGYYWVEDSTRHAKEGLAQGLNCILYTNEFNANFEEDGITKCSNWNEIHAFIKEDANRPDEPEPEPELIGQADVNQPDQNEPNTSNEREKFSS